MQIGFQKPLIISILLVYTWVACPLAEGRDRDVFIPKANQFYVTKEEKKAEPEEKKEPEPAAEEPKKAKSAKKAAAEEPKKQEESPAKKWSFLADLSDFFFSKNEFAEKEPSKSNSPPKKSASKERTSKQKAKSDSPFTEIHEGLLGLVTNFFEPEQPPPPPLKREYPYPIPQRMSLRDIQQRGIGYRVGYLTLDGLFAPDYLPGKFQPMLDLRGHRFDNEKWAANAGFVGRYVPETSCRMYGVNAYYDYREGCLASRNQIGLGFESLGKRVDFRVNGYMPIGSWETKEECEFNYEGGFFALKHQREQVYGGFNAEVGALAIKSRDFLLYGAIGPYFLTTTNDRSWGGKLRIRPQYKDYAAVEVSMSKDRIFKEIIQVQLIFSMPLYQFYPKKQKVKHPCLSDRQIYQPVERFEIIPVKCHCGWDTNF